MNVLHICVAGPYTDNMGYQENLLTKHHARLGNNTFLLASEWMFDENGKIIKSNQREYKNLDGVQIIRLVIAGDRDIYYHLKKFENFYEAIERCEPDVIFVHNLQFIDVKQIAKYAKKHKVTIYADNHADFSNSARSFPAKLFYKTVWRHYAQMLEPYVKKFYGVFPARVEFLKDIYKLPASKCELLALGADDDEVMRTANPTVGKAIREKYEIGDDDFLIITGGKIDAAKMQTLLLMQAVRRIQNPRVRLLVFGSIADEMKPEFNVLVDGSKVQYMGWVKGNYSYDIFSAADLVIFPGRHSVFWEQVCGQGKPMIVKYWDGATHVDMGGNVEFLYKDSVDEIYGKIMEIVENPEKYQKMKAVAGNKGIKTFSYKEIAARAINI